MRLRWPILATAALLAACGAPDTKVATDAKETAAALRETPTGGVSADPLCAKFSRDEIAAAIGEPVDAVSDTDGGCQWKASDGSGDAIVAVVPAGNHEIPRGSKGLRQLAGVGSDGFVASYFDGWLAGAIQGESAARVSTAGAGASAATTETLLTLTLAKMKG